MRKSLTSIEEVYDRMGIPRLPSIRQGECTMGGTHQKTFRDFTLNEFRKFMNILEEEHAYRLSLCELMEDAYNRMGKRREMMDNAEET